MLCCPTPREATGLGATYGPAIPTTTCDGGGGGWAGGPGRVRATPAGNPLCFSSPAAPLSCPTTGGLCTATGAVLLCTADTAGAAMLVLPDRAPVLLTGGPAAATAVCMGPATAVCTAVGPTSATTPYRFVPPFALPVPAAAAVLLTAGWSGSCTAMSDRAGLPLAPCLRNSVSGSGRRDSVSSTRAHSRRQPRSRSCEMCSVRCVRCHHVETSITGV